MEQGQWRKAYVGPFKKDEADQIVGELNDKFKDMPFGKIEAKVEVRSESKNEYNVFVK